MENKVILVGPYNSEGGMSRYVRDIIYSDISHRVISYDTSYPSKQNIIGQNLGYNAIGNAGPQRLITGILCSLRNIFSFPKFLLKRKGKVVHICGVSFWPFWERALIILICKIFSQRTFLHYLGAFDQFYFNSNFLSKKIIVQVLLATDEIAVLSNRVKNLISNITGRNDIHVIPSSVNIQEIENSKHLPFSSSDELTILFMGGSDPIRKGLKDIIEIVPVIIESNPDVNFVFFGSQTVDTELKEVQLRYPQNIKFYGWLKSDEKFSYFKSSDILLLPSYNEGLPYVIIEAIASGLPVISTNIGGIPEVIEDSKNGFIIEPGDKKSLKEKLDLLINDATLRLQMSKLNAKKAKKSYSTQKVFSQISSIYDNLGISRT